MKARSILVSLICIIIIPTVLFILYMNITVEVKAKNKLSEEAILLLAQNQQATQVTIDTSSLEKSNITDEQSQIIIDRIIEKVNQIRTNPLTLNNSLKAVADVRSREIVDTWSHTRSNDQRGIDLIQGKTCVGENLGKILLNSFNGSKKDLIKIADDIVNGWINSQTHYDNLVNGNFSEYGISIFSSSTNINCFYITMMFAN